LASEEEKPVTSDRNPETPRLRMSGFLLGLLATAVPFVVLFVFVAAMIGRGGELVWMLTLLMCVVALLVSGGFAILEKRRVALGVLAGAAVGILSLVLSCSVVLATAAVSP
jgi:uncharacterized membrane protein YdbT with pleckstrin-like domain